MKKQDESFILSRREFETLDRVAQAKEFERFMERPMSNIAAAITAGLAEGPKGWTLRTGRIVQGVLAGKRLEQLGKEINALVAANAIPKDYAETKYGFQSWVELLSVIDSECPDEDRLRALKALFLAVNKVGEADAQRVLAYQLFQIAKRLTSGQLLLLKACYDLRDNPSYKNEHIGISTWLPYVQERLGHSVGSLIEADEKVLIDFRMITGRTQGGFHVHWKEGRLTDLGLAFCNRLDDYDAVIARTQADQGCA